MRARTTLYGLTLLAGLGACSAEQAASPEGLDSSGSVGADTALVEVNALTRNASLEEEYVASVLVTPDSGGYLQIIEAGLIVYAPPGAVTDTITIWAKAIAGSTVAYEFGPHGTTFAQPVYVWQDLKSTSWTELYDQNKMEAGYFKDRSQVDTTTNRAYVGELRPAVAVYSVNKNNAVFTVSHFSGYLLSTGRVQTQ